MSQCASNPTPFPSVPSIATGSPTRPFPPIGCNGDGRTELLDDLRADGHDFVSFRHPVEISYPEKAIRRQVCFSGMAVETVTVTEPGRIGFRYQGRLHLLVLFEAGVRKNGRTFVEGVPASALRNCARKFVLVPAGHEYSDWHEISRPLRLAWFYFDPTMPAMLPRRGGSRLVPRTFFEHVGMWNTAIKLKELIDSPCNSNREYCEALEIVLAYDLAQFACGPRRSQVPVRGGLTGWQQQLLSDYIAAHLAQHISLTTLAGLVRLSPHHFCRAFKQSFGRPPHRFHMQLRVERAREMLADPSLSVTEIAFTLGFCGPSGLATCFRRLTGASPREYRRSMD
jgi:AraC family transcriptional regulator